MMLGGFIYVYPRAVIFNDQGMQERHKGILFVSSGIAYSPPLLSPTTVRGGGRRRRSFVSDSRNRWPYLRVKSCLYTINPTVKCRL